MLCTAVFKETVRHFLENGSTCNVYACLLDASSAFDRVHYGKLFDVLMKRNMLAEYVQHGVLVSQISSKQLTALNRAV